MLSPQALVKPYLTELWGRPDLITALQTRILTLMGIYLIIDGVVSIIEYRHQHWYEHAVRTVRAFIGLYLIIYDLKG